MCNEVQAGTPAGRAQLTDSIRYANSGELRQAACPASCMYGRCSRTQCARVGLKHKWVVRLQRPRRCCNSRPQKHLACLLAASPQRPFWREAGPKGPRAPHVHQRASCTGGFLKACPETDTMYHSLQRFQAENYWHTRCAKAVPALPAGGGLSCTLCAEGPNGRAKQERIIAPGRKGYVHASQAEAQCCRTVQELTKGSDTLNINSRSGHRWMACLPVVRPLPQTNAPTSVIFGSGTAGSSAAALINQ